MPWVFCVKWFEIHYVKTQNDTCLQHIVCLLCAETAKVDVAGGSPSKVSSVLFSFPTETVEVDIADSSPSKVSSMLFHFIII